MKKTLKKKLFAVLNIIIIMPSCTSYTMHEPIEHVTTINEKNIPANHAIAHAEIAHAVEFHAKNSEPTPVSAGIAQKVHEIPSGIHLDTQTTVIVQPIEEHETAMLVFQGKKSIYDVHGNKTQDIITQNGMQHITYYDGSKIIKESFSLPDGSEHLTYYQGNTNGVLMTDAMPEEHAATIGSIKQVKATLSPVISKKVILDSNKIKQQEIISRADKSVTRKYYDDRGALESILIIASDKSSIHNYYQSYPDYIVMTRSESYDPHGHKTHEWALNDSGQKIFMYYDAHGNAILNPNPEETVKNADGSTTITHRHNDIILLEVTTHTDGSTTTLEYDEENGYLEEKTLQNADGSGNSIYYDSTGQIDGRSTTVKNADGSFTTTRFDENNVMYYIFKAVHHADGSIEETHYADDKTTIAYTEIKHTDGTSELINYSDDGKIASRTKTYKNKTSETTLYNEQGQITGIEKTVENGSGSSTTTHYNANNQITQTSKIINNIDGSTETIFYKTNGILTASSKYNADGSGENITYYDNGKISNKYIIDTNGSSQSITYNLDGSISSSTHYDADNNIISS